MKRSPLFLSLFVVSMLLSQSGCDSTPSTPEDKISKISTAINLGTQTAVAIGFVAIPDATQANQVATLSAKVLDENVLPLLDGDEAALIAGLKSLLSLKAFDDPKLAKAKLLLEAGLPLLESYLPPDLADQQLDKLPADAKAYLAAFFKGARAGIGDYLAGSPRGLNKGFTSYADLRAKLAAK